MHIKHLYELCRRAVIAWVDDYAPSMGAAISYHTIFSLAPLLVIVIAVAGAIFGHDAVRNRSSARSTVSWDAMAPRPFRPCSRPRAIPTRVWWQG